MIDLVVKFDVRRYEREVAGFLRDQLPFAIALGLTRTAQHAQRELREALPQDFTIRSAWVARGLRIEPARKRHPEARVGTVDPFMPAQAIGGTKRPRGRGSVAVPVGARRPPSKRTTRATWPGALLRRRRAFIATRKPGLGPALWLRDRDGGLRLMWELEPRVHIPPRWPFRRRVQAAVDRRFNDELLAALVHATRTRAPRT